MKAPIFKKLSNSWSFMENHANKNPPDKKPSKHQEQWIKQRKSKVDFSVLHFVNNAEISNNTIKTLPFSGNLKSYVKPLP